MEKIKKVFDLKTALTHSFEKQQNFLETLQGDFVSVSLGSNVASYSIAF